MAAFKIPEPPYTIEGIMADLEAQYGGGGGEAPPSSAPNVIPPGAGESVRAMLDSVGRLNNLWPDYQIRSHRGLMRIFIDPVKKFLHWGTRPYVNMVIERQMQINSALLHQLLQILPDQAAKVDHHVYEVAAHGAAIAETARNQEAINKDFERRIEQNGAGIAEAGTHQAKINAYFEEAKARLEGALAELSSNQEKVNGYFEAARTKSEDFMTRQNELNRGWIERYDFGPFFSAITKEKRLALMDRFRTSFGHLVGLHHIYLDYFRNRPGQIFDAGCGRGEFLKMMHDEGIEAWGCEVDPIMIDSCREHGVHAIEADALTALRSIPDGSLGGIFASQVVEHLFPGELLTFLKLSREKLAPGGVIVLETVNPQSLGVLAKSYYKDLDHKQAIDPDYLAVLLDLIGFTNARAESIRPFDAPDRIPDLPPAEELGLTAEAHAALNGVVTRLNERIWGGQDFYAFAEKP